MNAEAKRLGLADTHYANPTGLSDSQQYSSARDLARLAARLQTDFPQYAPVFREREFTYNRVTSQSKPAAMERSERRWAQDGAPRSQRLFDRRHRVAAARRGNSSFERRLVAVLLGAPSDAVRAQDALRLLNHGYSAYDTVLVHRRGSVLARPEVWKGDRSEVPIGPDRDVYITAPTAQLQRLGERGLKSALKGRIRCSPLWRREKLSDA